MISVLLPTRGRMSALHLMLSTLYATVSDRRRVEVIARCDVDDQPTIDYLGERAITTVCKARVGYAGNAQMVNDCVALSRGELLLVANDDLEFTTPGWDVHLEAVAARYPDGLFDLGVDTEANNDNFCFPCQTRRQVDLLGGFYDERLVYPDIWLRDVLQPFGRAIRVPEVTIAHRWQGMTPDQATAAAVTRTSAYAALYAQCVAEGREKIRAVIQGVAA